MQCVVDLRRIAQTHAVGVLRMTQQRSNALLQAKTRDTRRCGPVDVDYPVSRFGL
jgi:hypothetical protein